MLVRESVAVVSVARAGWTRRSSSHVTKSTFLKQERTAWFRIVLFIIKIGGPSSCIMFYSVDIGYDLCGPRIANVGTVLLKERRNYVFRVTNDTKAPSNPAGEVSEQENGKEFTAKRSEQGSGREFTAEKAEQAWRMVGTDDKNVAKIALLGPTGEKLPGKLFFNFEWTAELQTAISNGKAPSDGGEAVVIEGTLDEAIHRAALMILKKGQQGRFSINIFGHQELPQGIPLNTTLTMEEAEEMQSDDNHFTDARVMVNNMELVLFQKAHDGEDEEKILRRRISKYSWWEKEALPKDYAVYRMSRVGSQKQSEL